MYRRFRFHHTRSSRPWAKGEIFVMGFPSSSPCGKSGFLPLSPSPGLSYRAETTLLNKLAFLSTTTGRFCSRCHVLCLSSVSLACDHILPCVCGNITEKKLRTLVIFYFYKRKPRKQNAFEDSSILLLHGKPSPDFLPEAFRSGDPHHCSKGQNADEHFRFIVFVIV